MINAMNARKISAAALLHAWDCAEGLGMTMTDYVNAFLRSVRVSDEETQGGYLSAAELREMTGKTLPLSMVAELFLRVRTTARKCRCSIESVVVELLERDAALIDDDDFERFSRHLFPSDICDEGSLYEVKDAVGISA